MRPNFSDTLKRLEALSDDVRAMRLECLNLGKALNPLKTAGVKTIGSLIQFSSEGFGDLRNFGRVAHNDVLSNLRALANSTASDGSVDWCLYAQELGLTVIFQEPPLNWQSKDFISSLSRICEAIIPAQLGARDWIIFKKRLLADPRERPTLEEIGAVFQLTRERVRQLQEQSIDVLRRPLISYGHQGLRFRIRPEIGEPVRQAATHFETIALPAWLRSRWIEELARTWQCNIADIQRHYVLLGELLSYEEVRPDHDQLEPFLVHASTSKAERERLRKAIGVIHEVLLDEPYGYDAFDLTSAVNRRLPKHGAIQLDQTPALVELCSSIESRGNDYYRIRFEFLKSRTDQSARILREHGEPLHHTDLCREINKRIPPKLPKLDKRNMVNQLTLDPRFATIGRTGRWALAEWGTENRSIISLIEESLHLNGEAMDEREIFDRIIKLRPVSEHSVPMLLSSNPERFRKVAPHLWALTEWGDGSNIQWWDKDEVGNFIAQFFQQRSVTRIDFTIIREAFMTSFGHSERSARGILAHHPAIIIERPNDRQRIACFQADWRNVVKSPQFCRTINRSSPITNKIMDSIREKLSAAPTKERPLIEIVKELEKEIKVLRPTVYAVVAQSDEIEAVPVDGFPFKICRFSGKTRPEFPQLNSITNIAWRNECKRAIEKLTLADVDIGLFMLGRQFDVSMKELLHAAKIGGKPPIPEGNTDKLNLNNRIEWALKHGLFSDASTVNLLRIERNERAHGRGPSDIERAAILKSAPYLAGLYLDYIVIIEGHLHTLRAK